jgi:hypothetical protein
MFVTKLLILLHEEFGDVRPQVNQLGVRYFRVATPFVRRQ